MWPLRQEPPRPPFCVSEASLNGQPFTLWSPLLGQIWEGESAGGWGFSKSGNLKKSSGEADFEVEGADAAPAAWALKLVLRGICWTEWWGWELMSCGPAD